VLKKLFLPVFFILYLISSVVLAVSFTDGHTLAIWNFDGNLLNTANSGFGDSITPTSITYVTGKFGYGINFNGSTGYLNGTAGTQPAGPYSYSFWVTHTNTSVTTWEVIWDSRSTVAGSYNGSTLLYQPSTDKLRVYHANLGSSILSDTLGIKDGLFHLITVTWDGANVIFYKDGINYGTRAYGTTQTTATVGFYVGRYRQTTAGEGFFSGILDDFGLFDRALTSNEVQTIWNSGTGSPLSTETTPSGGIFGFLVGFWNSITGVIVGTASYPIAFFQNIGLAVAGAIGSLFLDLFHYFFDIFAVFAYLFSAFKLLIITFLSPFSFIWDFITTAIPSVTQFNGATNAIPPLATSTMEFFTAILGGNTGFGSIFALIWALTLFVLMFSLFKSIKKL
jgi:hypothetical protein